jgi:hypothetical protein
MEAENAEIKRLKRFVEDLQSRMYINCVYCGHRYGPADEVPASLVDVLKAHIEACPKHPLAHLRAAVKDADYVFQNNQIAEYIFQQAEYYGKK